MGRATQRSVSEPSDQARYACQRSPTARSSLTRQLPGRATYRRVAKRWTHWLHRVQPGGLAMTEAHRPVAVSSHVAKETTNEHAQLNDQDVRPTGNQCG